MEESSQIVDKSLARTLMGSLTTMKFDGSRTIHEHVIEMTNIAARLKSLEMEIEQNFRVQFIVNSFHLSMTFSNELQHHERHIECA